MWKDMAPIKLFHCGQLKAVVYVFMLFKSCISLYYRLWSLNCILTFAAADVRGLQCFDTVGWVARRASGL